MMRVWGGCPAIASRWGALLSRLVLTLCCAFASGSVSQGADHLAAAQLLTTPAMTAPGYLEMARDPVFGTIFTRVTDPGREILPGILCGPEACTHRYSSAQAWNADQTLLVITNGCHGLCFLDGQSYAPLFHRPVLDECEWSPVEPELMICVAPTAIYAWRPRSDERMPLATPEGYARLEFGPYKGNLSRDGTRLVLRGLDPRGKSVAFAYDLPTRLKHRDIPLSELVGTNGYCGISPTGKFIFCMQGMPRDRNAAYVFTLEGMEVQHWTENHRPGHGDMTVDADGSDVYVGISKSAPDKYHVVKRRLEDGAVTDLAPYGEAQHASLRNSSLPGWVFVTYTGSYPELAEHPRWTKFYQEIIALRTDGSGEIRRIVQTRDAKYDYWSEAHASASPDGMQVIWSSNWGVPGGPVADYVARVAWPMNPSARRCRRCSEIAPAKRSRRRLSAHDATGD